MGNDDLRANLVAELSCDIGTDYRLKQAVKLTTFAQFNMLLLAIFIVVKVSLCSTITRKPLWESPSEIGIAQSTAGF